MATAKQYDLDRMNTAKTWSIVDIDASADDWYEPRTHTIRAIWPEGRICRLFLVATGTAIEPDPSRFKVLALHHTDLRTLTPESVVVGLGFLLDFAHLDHWKLKAVSLPSVHAKTSGTAGEGADWVLRGRGGEFPTGISVRDDGSVVLRGTNAEIVIGDGIVTQGTRHHENPEVRAGLMKTNPLRSFGLPSFVLLPVPAEVPSLTTFTSLGSIVASMRGI